MKAFKKVSNEEQNGKRMGSVIRLRSCTGINNGHKTELSRIRKELKVIYQPRFAEYVIMHHRFN